MRRLDPLDGDLGLVQGCPDLANRRLVDGPAASGRNLDRRVLGKDIGEGEDEPSQHRGKDQQVLPQGIMVHRGSIGSRDAPGTGSVGDGRRAAPWAVPTHHRRRGSELLDGAPGQDRFDRRATHLDVDAIGYLDLDKVLPQVGNTPDDTAGGGDLVALGQG